MAVIRLPPMELFNKRKKRYVFQTKNKHEKEIRQCEDVETEVGLYRQKEPSQ